MSYLIERIHASYEAWNSGDFDAWMEYLHPEVVLLSARVFPGFEPEYHGREGMAQFWRQLHEPWEAFRIAVESVEDMGDDAFLIAIRFRGIGAGSGVEVDMRFGSAVQIEDDLARVIAARRTPEEAVAALRARLESA